MTVELVIVERGGVRLGVPAGRVSAIDDLDDMASTERSARLQQRLGQPPLADAERCCGLRVDGPGGGAVVAVAGRVSIAAVSADEISPLPELLMGVAPVTAVVFDDDAPVLVLDADAMVEHARAVQ